jgi:hypothetical protein
MQQSRSKFKVRRKSMDHRPWTMVGRMADLMIADLGKLRDVRMEEVHGP